MNRIILFPLLSILILMSGCKPNCTLLRDLPVPNYMLIEPQVERIKLGDTLTLRLFAPYKTYRLDTDAEINIERSSISDVNIYIMTYFRNLGGGVSERTYNFNVIPVKGTVRRNVPHIFNATYSRENEGFVFEAKVIPLDRGVVRFNKSRPIGWMNGKCDKIFYISVLGNPSQNEHLIFDFLDLIPGPYEWDNHYYVWVE